MNATRNLIAQHRTIQSQFEAVAGEVRPAARARAVSRLTEELIAHMAGEETVFYPAARRALGGLAGGAPVDEHFMLRAQLRRVLATDVDGPAFEPRFEALRILFDHHAHVEETELFPRVEAALTEAELEALGADVAAARPPIWVVTTERHALIRSKAAAGAPGVQLPAVR
jgi:hemerythrin superfamily protein